MAIQGSSRKNALIGVISGVAMMSLIACGQEPSFLESENKGRKSSDQTVNTGGSVDDNGQTIDNGEGQPDVGPGADGTNSGGEIGNSGEDTLPGGGGNDWLPDWAEDPSNEDNSGGEDPSNPNPQNPSNPGTPGTPSIPGASDSDADALYKCLAAWKNHPFSGTVMNYKKIRASVSVGGMGNLINDNENTDQPYLILVDAAVNVLGSPTYNLMNRNGYYCMKVNVNVQTSLNINLHCNARLADQKVNVNVGSNQNSSTSVVGVHVLSNVQVNTVRPEGDTCIR